MAEHSEAVLVSHSVGSGSDGNVGTWFGPTLEIQEAGQLTTSFMPHTMLGFDIRKLRPLW